MILFNDPSVTIPLDIEGVTFHCKTLTTGQRLKMLDELSALEGVDADFDKLMTLLATYIECIQYTQDDGVMVSCTLRDEVEHCLVYMDDIKHQNELIKQLMAINRLSKGQAAN